MVLRAPRDLPAACFTWLHLHVPEGNVTIYLKHFWHKYQQAHVCAIAGKLSPMCPITEICALAMLCLRIPVLQSRVMPSFLLSHGRPCMMPAFFPCYPCLSEHLPRAYLVRQLTDRWHQGKPHGSTATRLTCVSSRMGTRAQEFHRFYGSQASVSHPGECPN